MNLSVLEVDEYLSKSDNYPIYLGYSALWQDELKQEQDRNDFDVKLELWKIRIFDYIAVVTGVAYGAMKHSKSIADMNNPFKEQKDNSVTDDDIEIIKRKMMSLQNG